MNKDEILGQHSIISFINNHDTWNHDAFLMLGEYGSEQDKICKYIARKFNIDYFDISDNFNKETVDEIRTIAYKCLISIDVNKVDQDMLLKMLEENISEASFILFAEKASEVKNTIKSRCFEWNLETYNAEQLSSLTNDSALLKLCTTPGQIAEASTMDIAGLHTTVHKLVKNLQDANYANTLSIANRIDYGEGGSFSLKMFVRALRNELLGNINITTLKFYKALQDFDYYINAQTDLKKYTEGFLTKLWEISHK